MKKTVLANLLTVIMVSMPITALADGQLTVLQKNLYIYPESSSGAFFAKVENSGDAPIAFDEGKLVVFSDNDDILISDDFINTLPYNLILEPGEYIYVNDSLYESALENATIGDIKFSVQTSDSGESVTRTPVEATFEVEGADSYNNYVYVTLTNESDAIQYDYYITAALLDTDGNILFSDRNCYETLGIHPNSTVTLKMYIDKDLVEYCEANGLTPASVEAIAYVINE